MSVIPTTTGTGSPTNTGASSNSSTASNDQMIASNFPTFLQLLTPQMQSQDPLDTLGTNQFTQQLVQFAQVEQQMKSNDTLASLLALEKNAQQTTALAYVGQTVVVDGSTTALGSNGATWSFNSPSVATANVVIKDSTGQTAYTGTFGVNPGQQNFSWDGRGNNGATWPAGNYTMVINATDANGQPVSVSSEVQATVDSVDLTQNPPTLSLNGASYTMDKIKRIVRPAAAPAA